MKVNDFREEVIVRFVDFVGIIDHRCLSFLFIIRRVKTEKQQTVIVIRSFNTEISTSLVHNAIVKMTKVKLELVCHYDLLLLLVSGGRRHWLSTDMERWQSKRYHKEFVIRIFEYLVICIDGQCRKLFHCGGF